MNTTTNHYRGRRVLTAAVTAVTVLATPTLVVAPSASAQNVAPNAQAAPQAAGSLVADRPAAQPNGEVAVPVTVSGFAPNAELTAKVGDLAAKWAVKRDRLDSMKADESGSLKGTIALPAGSARAGQTVTISVHAEGAQAETQIVGPVSLVLQNAAGNNDTSAGAEVKGTIANLPQGAVVNHLGTDKTNWLGEANATANEKGEAQVALTIPADAPVGAPIEVRFSLDGNNVTVPTGAIVTPSAAAVNEDKFTQTHKDISAGLYQSAYSAKENAVYVTYSVGRPPVKESGLLKLDADSLEQKAAADLARAADGAVAHPVYGVTVDDELGQVWVTNTRTDTVAVYDASDLKLIHQFDAGLIPHPRDVVIDPQTHKAYVSGVTRQGEDSLIAVFDAKEHKQLETINLGKFGGVMSMDLDPATGKLYTVLREEPAAYAIDTRNGNQAKRMDLPADAVNSGAGIAFDAKRGALWIASQKSNNVVVIDANTGQLRKNLDTGAGALNVAIDPVHDLAYVSNFGGATVSVFDAKSYAPVAQLAGPGPRVNHVTADGKGNVFAVNKFAREIDGKTTNRITKITPKGCGIGSSESCGSVTDPFGSLGSLNGGSVANGGNGALLGLGSLGIAGAIIGGLIWMAQNGKLPQLPPLPFLPQAR